MTVDVFLVLQQPICLLLLNSVYLRTSIVSRSFMTLPLRFSINNFSSQKLSGYFSCNFLYIYIYILLFRTETERFLEVAIDSSNRLSYQANFQVQLTLRANFVQIIQSCLLFNVRFHFDYCLRQ